MTRTQKSAPEESAVGAQSKQGGLPEVGVFEELLHVEPFRPVEPTGHRFSLLVSWLIATGRPTVTVELGPGDRASLASTCDAVSRLGAGARCLAVRFTASSASTRSQADTFGETVNECRKRFGSLLTAYDDEVESLTTLAAEANVDLLHVTFIDSDDQLSPDLSRWFRVMARGATVVVTSTAADRSSSFAQAKRLVSDRYPSVCMSLGSTTEALVAQVPIDGSAPIVDLLQDVPSAVGSLLAMFGEPREAHEHLGDEPIPPHAVRVLVAGLLEQQRTEWEALLSALTAYKDLSAQLAVDVADARRELTAQAESARLEREHLVDGISGSPRRVVSEDLDLGGAVLGPAGGKGPPPRRA